jgi:hypothetical protein
MELVEHYRVGVHTMSSVAVAMVILVAVGLAWFSYAGSQPVAHRPINARRLEVLLEALLYRGTGQTHLRIEVIDDDRSFLLRKYITPSERGSVVGISGELSGTIVDQEALALFRAELRSRGVAYSSDEAGQKVLVDCGRDLRLAAEIVRLVFDRVLNVHLSTQAVGYFEGLLPAEFPHLTGIKRPPRALDRT